MVDDTSSHGGFLDVATGTFSVDPSWGPMDRVYDAVLHRWLPTGREEVSQDWKSYFYQVFKGYDARTRTFAYQLHFVDADGHDRYLRTYSNFITTGGYGPEGLLFSPPASSTTLLFDPKTGDTVTKPNDWLKFVSPDGGIWWIYSLAAKDQMGRITTTELQIYRRDMATGVVATWYDKVEKDYARIAGFDDQGHPLIARVYPAKGTAPMFLLLAPDRAIPIGPTDRTLSMTAGWVDQHGVWFSGDGSLWLYSLDGKAQPVPIKATNTVQPFRAVGACI